MHTSKMSGWLSNSFLSKFSRKEADTWWHPPLEESDREGCNMSDPRGIGKRANSDWSFISSHKYKIDVKEEVVSMTELREAGRSVEIAARAFDRFSCNLEGQAGLII